MIPRNASTHKGQNGKVCIVGGCETFHGAPIFAALAAEATGVDLIFPVVSPAHREVTKQASYNFICSNFQRDYLTKADVPVIRDLMKHCDSMVIGPGLGDHVSSITAAADIIANAKIPVVVDAGAFKAVAKIIREKKKLPENIVLTPHIVEFTVITMIRNIDSVDKELIKFWAKRLKAVILLKGKIDHIIAPNGKLVKNETGNAGLTVGGTGDALAGVVAGLIALGKTPFDAACLAAKVIGRAGEELYKEQGHAYRTKDVIERIPFVLRKMK